ncbi:MULTISPECIES: ArsR/SmtB family transcription factor [unclassified Streptomyces]|uniref:ArsR/SmtB family transcription factor n=1 Tax=unclassified Streptomyces TaxID=2593676 RepID=UPI002E29E59A|nr:winged helix-turn-helix domain-containing protein [Streptomyces sp. NBC_01429]
MLRIHLTGDDLGRIRVAAGPALMWETVLSLHWARRRPAGPAGEHWRGAVAGELAPATGLLRELAPPRGYFPDFLTPYGSSPQLAEALDPVLRTPAARLREELALLSARRVPTPWLRELADGGLPAVRRLERAFHRYHSVAVAPFWPTVRAEVARERVRVSRLLADGGTEELLAGLSPRVRWRSPALEVDYPVRRELWPAGRGLLLVPSYFCHGLPITLVRQEETPVLVYPVGRRPQAAGQPPENGEALTALLGRSRAAVLEAAADGGNTSELARRAGMLISSASQHLAVLRRAGLVGSRRQANAVVHQVTSLGANLLAHAEPPPW